MNFDICFNIYYIYILITIICIVDGSTIKEIIRNNPNLIKVRLL